MVVCKWLAVSILEVMGWSVQAAMWLGASGYVVVAHEILVSAQGPLVLGFWVLWFGARVLTKILENIKYDCL